MQSALGVCWYPEQWPRELWRSDARRMQELGLRYVRIGEFAWSGLEPEPGRYDWAWLDEVFEILAGAGLAVVLGTPTAAPPRWLVDQFPAVLPVDEQERVRRFGSRRHYCFTSPDYRRESERIVRALAERYGQHAALAGWQTDNEYGCHDTTLCYCPACRDAFQEWLTARYGTIENLNRAWGTSFWSQTYRSFYEVSSPRRTVTEPNPAHVLDYLRFASHQVVTFNHLQVSAIRAASPGRFVTHNFMGFFTQFDHFRVGDDLDVASWDSYPLGFSERLPMSEEARRAYARTGHPDVAAFHHDLYRAVGRGRFWVMEQQPGPVNWASYNPSPAPGMVRLWTWEALAHGAEVVSYFRWRQAPFGQEQMHSGLMRPDFKPDVACAEVAAVTAEIARLGSPPAVERASVAMMFDYEADWVLRTQPHARLGNYLDLAFASYYALRSLGLDVDFVSRRGNWEGYRLLVVPCMPIIEEADAKRLSSHGGAVVLGPRSGSKTAHFQIPPNLPPGPLRSSFPIQVTRVESLRPGCDEVVRWNGRDYPVGLWREWIESPLVPLATFADGAGAMYRQSEMYYLGFWPTTTFLIDFLADLCSRLGLDTSAMLPDGVRVRRRGRWTFAFNYADAPRDITVPAGSRMLLGEVPLAPRSVTLWDSASG
jgi:beta-galactosidase